MRGRRRTTKSFLRALDRPADIGSAFAHGRSITDAKRPRTTMKFSTLKKLTDLELAALLSERWGSYTFSKGGVRAHVPRANAKGHLIGFAVVTPRSLANLVKRLRRLSTSPNGTRTRFVAVDPHAQPNARPSTRGKDSSS